MCPLPWLSAFLFEKALLVSLLLVPDLLLPLSTSVGCRVTHPAMYSLFEWIQLPAWTWAVWADLWWLFKRDYSVLCLCLVRVLKISKLVDGMLLLYSKCRLYSFCFVLTFFFFFSKKWSSFSCWCKLLVVWQMFVKTNICAFGFKSNFYFCLAVLNLIFVLKIWIVVFVHQKSCSHVYVNACRKCHWFRNLCLVQ